MGTLMRGGGFLILLGLVVSIWCASLWWSWSRASHWPAVPGTLLSAELHTVHHSRTGTNQHDSTSYSTDVRYRYTVNGRGYLGARYSVADWDHHLAGALANVNRVQQQQREQGAVDVHYNPRRPGDSALDVRVSPMAFLGLNAGLVLLSLGLAAAFPGPGASTYGKITTGTFLSAALLGIPFSFFGWPVNGFLIATWVVCLIVPFTGLAAPKPFRGAGRPR